MKQRKETTFTKSHKITTKLRHKSKKLPSKNSVVASWVGSRNVTWNVDKSRVAEDYFSSSTDSDAAVDSGVRLFDVVHFEDAVADLEVGREGGVVCFYPVDIQRLRT